MCIGYIVGCLPRGVESCSRKSAYALGKTNFTVASLTLIAWPGLFAITSALGTDLYSSEFLQQSSIEKTMSSAVNGFPSDHFIPGRRWKVNSVEAALTSHFAATQGRTSVKARF